MIAHTRKREMAPRNFQFGFDGNNRQQVNTKPTNHQHEGILLIAGR